MLQITKKFIVWQIGARIVGFTDVWQKHQILHKDRELPTEQY